MANKTTLNLGSALDIVNASTLKPRLMSALKKKPHIVLIADKVERSDTAGVQLIYSFLQCAKKKDLAVTWQKPSANLLDIAEKLGMSRDLELV
ncbi:MAG: anti-anti-sigma regulatory factor [Polaribacter sp.]|jgi:anti-anti-sigma regulatory factor